MPQLVAAIAAAAFANGATHVSLHVARRRRERCERRHPLVLAAVQPVVDAVGATLGAAGRHASRATSRSCGRAASSPRCACRRCTARSTG